MARRDGHRARSRPPALADVLARARQYAAALHGAGLRRGDHVGLLLPNCLEYLLLFHGCALGGFRPVHLNARYKTDDLRYVIPHSDMRVLITSARSPGHADYVSMLCELHPELESWDGRRSLSLAAAPELRAVYCLHASGDQRWPDLATLLALATDDSIDVETDPEAIALVMYTSGTTAHPKACLLSHRALETAGRGLAQRFRMTRRTGSGIRCRSFTCRRCCRWPRVARAARHSSATRISRRVRRRARSSPNVQRSCTRRFRH
jgi:fatty-acyl-CoA synthase